MPLNHWKSLLTHLAYLVHSLITHPSYYNRSKLYNYRPFEKMRLSVFRYETPEILTSFESYGDDCPLGHLFRGEDLGSSLPEHSIWYHVKTHSPLYTKGLDFSSLTLLRLR